MRCANNHYPNDAYNPYIAGWTRSHATTPTPTTETAAAATATTTTTEIEIVLKQIALVGAVKSGYIWNFGELRGGGGREVENRSDTVSSNIPMAIFRGENPVGA